jgi:hypothetical protein
MTQHWHDADAKDISLDARIVRMVGNKSKTTIPT